MASWIPSSIWSRTNAGKLGDIEALKEGIVAILASPSFLLINPGEDDAADRFATKLSYFLKSTTPDAQLQQMAPFRRH